MGLLLQGRRVAQFDMEGPSRRRPGDADDRRTELFHELHADREGDLFYFRRARVGARYCGVLRFRYRQAEGAVRRTETIYLGPRVVAGRALVGAWAGGSCVKQPDADRRSTLTGGMEV